MDPEITREKLIRAVRDQIECELLLGAPWLPFERMSNKPNMTEPDDKPTGQMTMAARAKKQINEMDKRPMDPKQKKLDQIAKVIAACGDCPLHKSRKNCVFGEGDPNARIVFVGEAPGQSEDEQGRPFVGRSGELLTNIIGAMGLSRQEVFIGNILKCRPPNNANPTPEQVDACSHFLHEQLAIIEPEIIIALGTYAAQTLLKCTTAIGVLRGSFHQYSPTSTSTPIKLLATYHPSYLLRNYDPDGKRKVWEDMQRVLNELGLPIPKKKKS